MKVVISLYLRFEKWGYTGLLLSVCPLNFCVKDFSTKMQARVIIFGMHIDDDMLYRGFANQHSPAYSSLNLFNFFLYIHIHVLQIMIFFVKYFCETLQDFESSNVDNDVLWHRNQPSPAYSSLYLSDFQPSPAYCHPT